MDGERVGVGHLSANVAAESEQVDRSERGITVGGAHERLRVIRERNDASSLAPGGFSGQDRGRQAREQRGDRGGADNRAAMPAAQKGVRRYERSKEARRHASDVPQCARPDTPDARQVSRAAEPCRQRWLRSYARAGPGILAVCTGSTATPASARSGGNKARRSAIRLSA